MLNNRSTQAERTGKTRRTVQRMGPVISAFTIVNGGVAPRLNGTHSFGWHRAILDASYARRNINTLNGKKRMPVDPSRSSDFMPLDPSLCVAMLD